MKKILLLMFLFVGTTLFASINIQSHSNDEDSHICKLYAYNQALNSGNEYGSEEWQFVYYLEYRFCEAQEEEK